MQIQQFLLQSRIVLPCFTPLDLSVLVCTVFCVRCLVIVVQLSDMDARVLNELLADPAFMKSLREQGLEGIDAISDTTAGIEGEGGEDGTEVMSKSPEAGSGSLAVVERGSRRKSEYESATMQVVEELQESVRGLVAKLTAAIESAGKLFAVSIMQIALMHSMPAMAQDLSQPTLRHCCVPEQSLTATRCSTRANFVWTEKL